MNIKICLLETKGFSLYSFSYSLLIEDRFVVKISSI